MIFVVGAGRSGTTLLASIIGAHPDVELLPETSLLRRHLLPTWNRPLTDEDCHKIQEDPRAMRFGDQLELRRGQTGREVFEVLLANFAMASVPRILEKDPRLIEHVDELAVRFPQAKFVEIRRRPVDVVASRLEAEWSSGDGFHQGCAKTFVGRRLGEIAAQTPVTSARYHSIDYEDLMQSTSEVLTRLNGFLDLEDQPNQLDNRQQAAERLVSGEEMQWKGRTLEPLQDRSGTGSRCLSDYQRRVLGDLPIRLVSGATRVTLLIVAEVMARHIRRRNRR